MTANTICSHFAQISSEYGLPSHIHADFGTQYINREFRKMCENIGIKLTFGSPYHHQANSVAERAIGTRKSMWKKALDGKKWPYSAMRMYTICHHRMSWCMDASPEYWHQVATTLYNQVMRTTSTTETWTNYTRRNKLSTTTEQQVKLTGDLFTPTNLCTCTTSSQTNGTKLK